MAQYDAIDLARGVNKNIPVQIVLNGEVADIEDLDFRFMVKRSVAEPDSSAVIDKSNFGDVADGIVKTTPYTGGIIYLQFTNTDHYVDNSAVPDGMYTFELRVYEGTDEYPEVMVGRIYIHRTIIRS